jgi:ABC-type Fe3+ transport system permease subunit
VPRAPSFGKGQPPRLLRLGPWRWMTLAYALIYLGLTVVLPYLVLLYAALISQWGAAPVPANLTLARHSRRLDADVRFHDPAAGIS